MTPAEANSIKAMIDDRADATDKKLDELLNLFCDWQEPTNKPHRLLTWLQGDGKGHEGVPGYKQPANTIDTNGPKK